MQCYDCVGNADRSWRTRVMAYGFSLFNGITLAGRKAMGLSAGLRGNGMCISTSGLRRVPWHAHGLVEDLEYSWIVRVAGERVEFIEDTTVFATMLSRGGTPLAEEVEGGIRQDVRFSEYARPRASFSPSLLATESCRGGRTDRPSHEPRGSWLFATFRGRCTLLSPT